jgi:uncharacterized protein (TIGR02453 family)
MITPATLSFLRDLKAHNQRAWFHRNRARYDAARAEMVHLVDAVMAGLAHFEPHILEQDPEDCLFRINRDTRFATDKTPYKVHLGAFITDRGRRADRAGYYVHVQPGECLVAGGLYQPPGPQLKAVRRALLEDAASFRRILRRPGVREAIRPRAAGRPAQDGAARRAPGSSGRRPAALHQFRGLPHGAGPGDALAGFREERGT